MSRIDKNGLKISSTLFEFINNEVIPGTNVKSDDFWNKFEKEGSVIRLNRNT